ncbi:2-hydroxymuconate tautomerase [Ligilactobacillus sp. Marseille-Q7487]|uniref:2-hydroxymuconate tautomerase n=1 Tax=Ligilactobacillus sp. Marseille-Q7487 TaxID=3022128 RepID=UPI0024A8A80A|nr:2-hydroxymuconate tautomerase [Ligilactobacillus sp. Marseille-Q7487]
MKYTESKRGIIMPLIHIELIEGRSQEQLKQLVEDVTTAVTKNTGAPAEHVHVILNEMKKDRYAVGGVLKSDEDK